jgi:hypothetical protein
MSSHKEQHVQPDPHPSDRDQRFHCVDHPNRRPLHRGRHPRLASVDQLQHPRVSEPLLEGILTFVLGSLWYFAVRLLEKKWPSLGWLLGAPVQPTYGTASNVSNGGTE